MAKGENIFKRRDGRWETRYITPPETPNRKQLASANCYLSYRSREFELIKSAVLSNETAISEDNLPKNGDTITYSLQITHKGDASYDLLPLTDHMTGA